VALRCGFRILRGEVLDAPRHGVWSCRTNPVGELTAIDAARRIRGRYPRPAGLPMAAASPEPPILAGEPPVQLGGPR